MDAIQRFGEYAEAFEKFFESNDASLLEPYFTEDAVYETLGAAAFAGRIEGREAVFTHMKNSLDSFDRRFSERQLEAIEGPELRDGAVWMRWRVTYKLDGAPDLVIDGEETAEFEGDRIERLEDRMPEDASEMLGYLETHAAKLGPAG